MGRRASFLLYEPRTILNKAKRPDHWFWTRYSAYPYLGCQHGCEFCYCRERKYSPYDDPQDFAYVIRAKANAPELLEKALRRVPIDLVFTGDYQPAERRFGLSRRMLRVCCDLGFPVFVLERSPLVLRDLDVLQSIQARAPSVVAFSVISTPDSPHADRVRALERLAPPPEKRFAAMERVASQGILTGTCAMPLLPGLCDDPTTIDSIVRWTADHGGRFVLAAGLTLADQQRAYFLEVVQTRMSDLIPLYRTLYPQGSYGPAGPDARDLACRVREACVMHGLKDRIPRPILATDKRAANRRLAEWLADRAYDLELEGAPSSRVWSHRRAAWAVEDLPQDIRRVHEALGRRGLESMPGVTPQMASIMEQWLTSNPIVPLGGESAVEPLLPS